MIVSTAITVAFTWIHTLFIPVIGLEIGTMSLTGRFVGARDPDAAVSYTHLTLPTMLPV